MANLSWFTTLFKYLFGSENKQEYQLVMTGLDGAGKTEILFQLRLGEVTTTRPISGLDIQSVKSKNLTLYSFDILPKEEYHHTHWREYLQQACTIIFVIDSNDRDRFSEAREQFDKILTDEYTHNAAFLIFANKCDLPNSFTTAELTDKLGLHQIRNRKWFIQPCCAVTRDGLYEGFDWVYKTICS